MPANTRTACHLTKTTNGDILARVTTTRTNQEAPWRKNKQTTQKATTMPIDEKYFCENCGCTIYDEWNYCPGCGKPTGNNTEWSDEDDYYEP